MAYPTSEHGSSFDIIEEDVGQVVRLRVAWNQDIQRLLDVNSVEHLFLAYQLGWRADSLEFIKQFRQLKSLVVIPDYDVRDLSAIQSLDQLRHLRLVARPGTSLDFSSLRSLESVEIEFVPGLKSVFGVTWLKRLVVNRMPKAYVDHVGRMLELRELVMLSCAAESLACLASLTRLERLRLARFFRLSDCLFLSGLGNLRELQVQSSAGFYDLGNLESCRRLERLFLETRRPVRTVRMACHLPKLAKVWVSRDTKVEDDSLDELRRLRTDVEIVR